jgi:hypothetical protein
VNQAFLDGLRAATNLCVVAKWSRGGTHYFALTMKEVSPGLFEPAEPYVDNHDPDMHTPKTLRAFYVDILPQLLPADKIAAIVMAEKSVAQQMDIRDFFMLLLRELRNVGIPLETITWYWWGKEWSGQSRQSEVKRIYHANGDVYYGDGVKVDFLCPYI